MNLLINQVVQSVLQKDTLEQCSVQELQQLAVQYPYFDAVQLLLAKKLQSENEEQYKKQLQRTSLHFKNPLWLEYLLTEMGNAEVISPAKEEITAAIIEETAIDPGTVENSEPELIVEQSTFSLENKEPELIVQQSTPSLKTKEPELIFQTPAPSPVETIEPVTGEIELNIPSLKIEAIDPAKAELTFEPFHSVDYFASQGIKFKEEEKPKDKFGVQLKSFTDWLKAMKRLPVAEVAKNVAVIAEQKVEQLAEHSIKDREVITEAMAEVWEKQGNIARAIDVYHKLSLLDPPKSAYFATKIEELKKIN